MNQYLLLQQQQYNYQNYYKKFYSQPILGVKEQQKPVLDVKEQQKAVLGVKEQQKAVLGVKEQQKAVLDVKEVKENTKIDLENYKLIKNEIKKTIIFLSKIKNKKLRLNYLENLKTVYKFNNENNNSLEVCLLEGYIVKKKCYGTSLGNYMFQNEVSALSKLNGYPHFPILFEYDPDKLIIYMSYCGDVISSKNIALNWKEQFNEISEIMTVLKVNSNDMIPRNICCLDNEIKIIDFGLNTIFGKTIKEVLNDLYGQLNNINKQNQNQNQNQNNNNNNNNINNTELNYLIEYKGWREKLKNYIKKEEQIKELHNKFQQHLKDLKNFKGKK